MTEKENAPNYIEMITPSIRDEVFQDGLTRTYLWKVDEKRNIFLYLTATLKKAKDQSILFVTSNVDSSEVKGQGNYIWQFMKKELQKFANGELHDIGKIDVISRNVPNEYSRRLPENDPEYIEKDGVYYGMFFPED